MTDLLAIGDEGLYRLAESARGWTARVLRATRSARCVAVDPHEPSVVYLGTRGDGVWKSVDAGRSWSRVALPEHDVFSLAVSPADGTVYVGCEPSRLFASRDAGGRWDPLDALVRLPSAPTWSFPPRPWTSHVSAIAPHPRRAGVLLVGIELGGLMLSEDAGESWHDHRPGAQRDVHAVVWHPRDDDRAYQAGGGGAARSSDRGRTWWAADAGRERSYCWGLAVDETEDDTWFVSASHGPRAAHGDATADAGVYRWRGDGPWVRMAGGLPEPLDDMPYALASGGGRLFVGVRSGAIMESDDRGDRWGQLQVAGASLTGLRVLIPV